MIKTKLEDFEELGGLIVEDKIQGLVDLESWPVIVWSNDEKTELATCENEKELRKFLEDRNLL